jgi:hypothetical protein
MKTTHSTVLIGALVCLAGCASPTNVVVLEPIGPAPTRGLAKPGNGSLQVYSAQQRADIDPNMEEWFWNDDFGKNDFLYTPAHTDYTIYSQEGGFLKRVRNARDPNDPAPALVALPPGRYEIQAEAADAGSTVAVKVPVVIRPGETTKVHLVSGWKPHRSYTGQQVVRLPDGDIAGWLAAR